MSECQNPNCPTHGSSPEAQARRQAIAEIKSNEELMSAARLLASNAAQATAEAWEASGQPLLPPQLLDHKLHQMLTGHSDNDPMIQGIVRGLAVLLSGSHEPTKIFVTECSKVKEEPYVVDRLANAEQEKRSRPRIQHIPGLGTVLSFSSLEELSEVLKDRL